MESIVIVRAEVRGLKASRRRGQRPPVGRAGEIRRLIQASSPEIWSETISGSEAVLARKWGSLFLAYLL